jgi:catechol 2,3-dioxygenase-like lactoylglutathione lyase family enzyme
MPLIHTCYRITDIDRSIAFYNALGFEEVGRIPIGDEAINVFMNQPGDGDMPRLELTHNFGVDSYELGSGANLDLYSVAQAADGTWRLRAANRTRPDGCPSGRGIDTHTGLSPALTHAAKLPGADPAAASTYGLPRPARIFALCPRSMCQGARSTSRSAEMARRCC